MSYPIDRLRADFPMLKKHGVYLDNAATTYKPQCVVDAITRYYTDEYATVNRAIYSAANEATGRYEMVRQKVAGFVGARSSNEIVFVRSTTEALNLLAATYSLAFMSEGDEVIISSYEHHANIVPWQLAAERHGIVVKVVPEKNDGTFDLEAFEKLITPKTKLVSVAHITNSTGYLMPLEKIVTIARKRNIHIAVDGAQAAPHLPLNLVELDVDFYTFSAHKMYGPTGIGVLYGKEALLNALPPYQGGGDMIDTVTFDKTTYQKAPHRFEPGTPNIAGVMGLGAAIDYLEEIGLDKIHRYETSLLDGALNEFPDIEVHSHPRSSILTFTHRGIHPLDLGTFLSIEGISVRTGHLCAQPMTKILGQDHLIRASVALYTTHDEISRLKSALHAAEKTYLSEIH